MVKVIGLCGSIGAGKNVVSKFLVKEYNYVQITIGDVVREELSKRGVPITRDNSDRISEEMRKKYGITYWVEQCIKKIVDEKYERAVIDGVRLPSDNELIKKSFGDDYVLFKVDADEKIRFERLKSRGRPGFPKTPEEFKKHEERQNKLFNLNETFKQAKAVIDNSTTLNDLYERIRKLKIAFPKWF